MDPTSGSSKRQTAPRSVERSVRRGSVAGINRRAAVYQRAHTGLLTEVRLYDDVERPALTH